MTLTNTASVAERPDCTSERADDRWCSLPRGRAVGSVPWLPVMWHPTLEQEQAVEGYLASKSGAEQLALARLMRDCEIGCIAPARSRTITEDCPWLQKPGAAARIAAEWHARLEGAK